MRADTPVGAPPELPDDPEIDALLRQLDHPLPPMSVEAVRRRARAAAHTWRWAAGIVGALAIASAAAYAAPGSPLPSWIEQARRTLGLEAPPVAPAPAPPAPSEAGIAVPAGASLLIQIVETVPGGYARVELGDGSEVVVRGRAGSTRFASEPDRLVVAHPTPDTLQVLVPRASARVEVLEGARRILIKVGEGVTAVAGPVGDGVWVLPLGG